MILALSTSKFQEEICWMGTDEILCELCHGRPPTTHTLGWAWHILFNKPWPLSPLWFPVCHSGSVISHLLLYILCVEETHTHTPVWNSKQYAEIVKKKVGTMLSCISEQFQAGQDKLWSIVLEISLTGLCNCSVCLRLKKKKLLNCWYCWVWDVYSPRFNPWNSLSFPVNFQRVFFLTLDLNLQHDRWTYIL